MRGWVEERAIVAAIMNDLELTDNPTALLPPFPAAGEPSRFVGGSEQRLRLVELFRLFTVLLVHGTIERLRQRG